jgi:hypothetical protein
MESSSTAKKMVNCRNDLIGCTLITIVRHMPGSGGAFCLNGRTFFKQMNYVEDKGL